VFSHKGDSFNPFHEMQMSLANLLRLSRKPCSSKRVPRTLTDGTLTEREQKSTERIQNGNGTDTERVRNGDRTDTERIQNGNRNACGTETERVRSSVPC